MMINNNQYIKAVQELLLERSSTHEIYFMTFTFTDMKQERHIDDYHEFFRNYRQRLDNVLLSNTKKFHRRPILLLYPEQYPALHFHGFLLIHKDTSEKFNRRCVQSITEEYIEKLGCFKPSLELKKKFIEPYSKARYQQVQALQAVLAGKLKSRTQAQKQVKLFILIHAKFLTKLSVLKLFDILRPEIKTHLTVFL